MAGGKNKDQQNQQGSLVKSTRRRTGRPASSDVREDCAKIASLLAQGGSELDIRRELHLSRRAYNYRLRTIRRLMLDAPYVWAKHRASIADDLNKLSNIRAMAMQASPPQLAVAKECTVAMARIRREAVEIGQSLGIYDKAADRLEVIQDPTLGLFHDIELEPVEVLDDDLVSADKPKTVH